MLLKKLIKKTPKNIRKIDIKSLTSDSRKVKNGYLFFAVKGTKVNGEIFINEAIRRGASAVVCSKTYKSNFVDSSGCGDVFFASFLSYTLKNKPLIKSLDYAVKSATESCEHFGYKTN